MPTNNNAKGDTKFYNLVAFFVPRICWCLGIASVYKRLVYPFLYFDLQSGNGDLISLVIYYFHSRLKSAVIFIGFFMGFITFWRIGLSVHRRLIQRAKIVSQYGKWAIITGSTSVIGKDFADYLSSCNMNLLLIAKSDALLDEQAESLIAKYGISIKTIAHDFTSCKESDRFYEQLDEILASEMSGTDDGLGILVNNVSAMSENPVTLEEMSSSEVDSMMLANMHATVGMTRAVLKYMKQRSNGCVISISSASGNTCAPFLSLYSATKAFVTQFSRSMHIECWGSGVDFYVVTPFYVLPEKQKSSASLFTPVVRKLIEGTICQLGKPYVWQGHGYWFHGLMQTIAMYYWESVARNRKMMVDNRLKRLKKEK